jgi:hypothetical protein
MPIWKITDKGPAPVKETSLKREELLEEHLEDWIASKPDLLGERLLVIGRQVMIPEVRDRIDVLAIDPQGNAVIIELKRGELSDPVDMQALRYASYISKWTFVDFENQARISGSKVGDPDFNFNEEYERFCAEAGVDEVPDLNTDQRIIIVGSQVRAKLGSVALWLLEHKIDIKVIEIEAYQEGDSLFVQPQVIVPLPVSRFTETGQVKEGVQPWRENGKSWHLEQRCSPETRSLLLTLDDLILEHFEVDGPRWSQKLYVAYRVRNYNWLTVRTRATVLRLDFLVKAGAFTEEGIAERLSVKVFDKSDSLAEKLELPSSVHIEHRNESSDRIKLRVKEDFDLRSEAFLEFLRDAYEAFPK